MSKNNQSNDLPVNQNKTDPNTDVKGNEAFDKVKASFLSRLEANPEKTIKWMFALIAFSIIANVLYYTFRKPDPTITKKEEPILSIDPLSTGIGKIVQAGSSLNETYRIKDDIDKLLSKDSLTGQDSIKLLALFEQLNDINRKLSPISKPTKK